jgi:hypothetical protein
MLRSRFALVSLAGLALGFSLAIAGEAPSATCENFLGDSVYRCEVQGEDLGDTFFDCFRFNSSAPSVSEKFDLGIDLLGDTLGCSCMATGSFTHPNPNASKEFTCVGSTTTSSFQGKVAASGKIKGFEAAFSDGFTFLISCKEDANCNEAPTFASPFNVNPYKRR